MGQWMRRILSSSPFWAIWLPGQIQHFCRQIAQLHLMAHGRQLLGKIAKAAPRIQDAQRPVAKAGQAGFDVAPHHCGADAPLGGVINVASELVGAPIKTLILLQDELNSVATGNGPDEKEGILSHPEFAENSRRSSLPRVMEKTSFGAHFAPISRFRGCAGRHCTTCVP